MVREARRVASPTATAEEVAATYDRGTEGDRLVALATMQAVPAAAEPERIARSITSPLSRFEQYHALLFALRAADAIAPDAGRRIADAIIAQRRPDGSIASGRRPVAPQRDRAAPLRRHPVGVAVIRSPRPGGTATLRPARLAPERGIARTGSSFGGH